MRTEADSQSERMRRYLLGALTEAEQVTLEQQFFADGEMLDRVWATESELVDGYVRGRLPHAEREQFERHYLPQHRERVAFAKELLRMADEVTNENAAVLPATANTPTESFWAKFLAALRTPQFALGAAAVVALALLGGAWLVRDRVHRQQQLAQSQTEQRAREQRLRELEAQVAQQRDRNSQLSAELEQLREEQHGASSSIAPGPSRPTIFSYLLLPPVRASTEQQVLRIPANISQVQLRMKIERGDYQHYQASLRAVDGGGSWPAASVKASTDKGGVTVSVLIPAAKLARGDYILTLAGIDAGGTAEEIDRYFFRVSNK
jgi:hypothetical protein